MFKPCDEIKIRFIQRISLPYTSSVFPIARQVLRAIEAAPRIPIPIDSEDMPAGSPVTGLFVQPKIQGKSLQAKAAAKVVTMPQLYAL